MKFIVYILCHVSSMWHIVKHGMIAEMCDFENHSLSYIYMSAGAFSMHVRAHI